MKKHILLSVLAAASLSACEVNGGRALLICETNGVETFRSQPSDVLPVFDARGPVYFIGNQTYSPRGGELCSIHSAPRVE